MSTSYPLTVLDIFCGAGGLSLGFLQAGFDVVSAIDNNAAALETYNENLEARATEADLSHEIDLPKTTVIIGGPPCQGFSSAGLRRTNDQRNSLINRFAHIVQTLRPAAFVFENVEGFLTAEGGTRVMELLIPLVDAGYRIHLRKINAANYGVPQHRKRVIAIGGLGWNPTFPKITHSAYGAPGAHLASTHLPPVSTLAQALIGLPSPTTEPPGLLQGHYYRPLEGLELVRSAALKPGQTMRDLPQELQHKSYRRRASRRVMDGTPTERRGGAPTGIRRLRPDEPSKAITGGAQGEFLHPSENRPLTVRECARLQTFPDTFAFYGSNSQQMQLVGNAIPPLLAYLIGQTLAEDLANIQDVKDDGALLSFVPTLSNGLSPALKSVKAIVNARFVHGDTGKLFAWD